VASRVEVGRGCGSTGECKGSNCRASRCAFIGRGGATARDYGHQCHGGTGGFDDFQEGVLEGGG
jgi:hypothetical protein